MPFQTAGIEVALWVSPLVAFAISFFTSTGGTSGAFPFLAFNGSSSASSWRRGCSTVRGLGEGEIKLSRKAFERSGAASVRSCLVRAAF